MSKFTDLTYLQRYKMRLHTGIISGDLTICQWTLNSLFVTSFSPKSKDTEVLRSCDRICAGSTFCLCSLVICTRCKSLQQTLPECRCQQPHNSMSIWDFFFFFSEMCMIPITSLDDRNHKYQLVSKFPSHWHFGAVMLWEVWYMSKSVPFVLNMKGRGLLFPPEPFFPPARKESEY